MNLNKYRAKIGYCDNKYLRGLEHIKGGHYVYIRNINEDGSCNVNIVTSLENKDKTLSLNKIQQVKKGNTYPIPFYDANFTRWSGINKNSVKCFSFNKISDINEKKVKKRHNFFIGKFMK